MSDEKTPSYDPMKDEKKLYTHADFVRVAKAELDAWEATSPANEYHGQPHTWGEWWNTFHRYMSW